MKTGLASFIFLLAILIGKVGIAEPRPLPVAWSVTEDQPVSLSWSLTASQRKLKQRLTILAEEDGKFGTLQRRILRAGTRRAVFPLAAGRYRIGVCLLPCRKGTKFSKPITVLSSSSVPDFDVPTTPPTESATPVAPTSIPSAVPTIPDNEKPGDIVPTILPTALPTTTTGTEIPTIIATSTPTSTTTATPTNSPPSTATNTPTSTPTATPTATPVGTSNNLLPGSNYGIEPITVPAVGVTGNLGFSAQVIARWSTVPYQVVTDSIRIGVVAFHRNGIDRVSFSANDGPWVDVKSEAINPSSGVSEYWVTLNAANFSDGPVEVRAVAYPKDAGLPRVLAGAFQSGPGASPARDGEYSLFLTTNAGGTYNKTARYVAGTGDDTTGLGTITQPYRTLARAAKQITDTEGSLNNATIYCLPGEYEFKLAYTTSSETEANDQFLTIAAAPGVSRDQVILTEGRPKAARVHLRGVTLIGTENGNFYTGYTTLRPLIWVDASEVRSLNGRYVDSQDQFNTAAVMVTNSTWTDTANGPVGAIMVRGTTISMIKSDLVSGAQLVLNVTGSGIDAANTGAHPDIYQIYYNTGGMDNHIVYGLYASDFTAQGIFIASLPTGEKIRNSAFVNIVLDPIQSAFTSQLSRGTEHVIFSGITMKQTFFIRTDSFLDTVFTGNLFDAVALDLAKTTPSAVAQITWEHNHFVDVTSYGTYSFGTDKSTGEPQVQSYTDGDFTPLPGSILKNRYSPLMTKVDVLQNARPSLCAVGAQE